MSFKSKFKTILEKFKRDRSKIGARPYAVSYEMTAGGNAEGKVREIKVLASDGENAKAVAEQQLKEFFKYKIISAKRDKGLRYIKNEIPKA